jgi:hypothetical protein
VILLVACKDEQAATTGLPVFELVCITDKMLVSPDPE